MNTEGPEGPWRITFDTNPDDCNLACIMCEEHSPYQRARKTAARKKSWASGKTTFERRVMDITIIERVIEEASNLGLREVIPSTMGEPLLYEKFDRIIDKCRNSGVLLNLTTNGTFPGRSVEDWGNSILPIGSDVKISWNGASAEINDPIMTRSSFSSRLSKLKRFVACRDEVYEKTGHYCRLSFQMTFMKRNYRDIPNIIKLAAELGIDRVKGHHLWVHHPGMEAESMRLDDESIRMWNELISQLPAIRDEFSRGNGKVVALENFYNLSPGVHQEVNPEFVCPFLGREAWVAWDGTFNPCCAPDELRKTLGSFGNLNRKSLREIWTSSRYRKLVHGYKENAVCQNCNMRRPLLDCVR
ncbi:MAG: SPASM domain-containing protein [Promethearchaeota archaeon]